MNNNVSIWEKIYNGMEAAEQRSADNWDRYAAAIKRKTSGLRWTVVKKIATVLGITGIIVGFAAFWAIGIALVGISIILGLAAKS